MFHVAFIKILTKYILKKGGVRALLFFGDLIVKTTKTKVDDEMWEEVRPVIEKFK